MQIYVKTYKANLAFLKNNLFMFYHTAQSVRNMPAVQETQAQSLGQEDPCRREWQSTPVFLPGEFHGQWTQVGYSLWCCKQLDTTERLTLLLTDKGCYSYTVLK